RRSTGTHDRVQLVDEQDHIRRLLQFIHYSLHPLFKLAAVFCSGHERSEVEGHYPFAKENARYFLLNNPEGQTFSYSGLTNTRFTDQYRVVLLSPGKDLSYAFNFFFAAHDGIQFIVFRQTGKVATKVIEHRR